MTAVNSGLRKSMSAYYFERALFIVGDQNSGKSVQLRSMFHDVRLGTSGNIPPSPNLPEMYRLSNERSLYIRLTSPHERGEYVGRRPTEEDVDDFLDKTEEKIEGNTPHMGRRWNFACPLQPLAARNMPDVVDTVRAFHSRFDPERIRVLFLSPDRHGALLQGAHLPLVAGLRTISMVEIGWIDARDRTANGLLIADFFDFA
jgi:hypothetical protein